MYSAHPPNEVFTAFAFLGFLLCAIPLPWHLEAWNTGTCLYMIWTGLACLNQFINSIVWNGNAINWAPVWCDISAKFIAGTAVAIPAASLCINRRLYHIASIKSITVSKAEKRRSVIVDLSIGVGLPVLEMILQYIPQGHRFNIYEDVGCWAFTYDTWVAYLLVSFPPILIGLVSGVYAVLSIIAFNKSRTQFNELLSGHSNLTANRYVRLMCLAGIEVICTVPLGCYAIYLNAGDHGIRPWKGWADTHRGFSRVDQIPSLIWRADPIVEVAVELSRWLCVVCAVIFFAFFGFADEARKNYRSATFTILKRVGINTASFSGTSSDNLTSSTGNGFTKSKDASTGKIRPVLPVFVHKEMLRRQDSLDSFSNMSLSIADAGGLLNEKKDDEKESKFSPTLSYGGITLSDVGGTLADYSESPISPIPSSGSSASSISVPSPAVTRQNSHSNIEISSVRRDSTVALAASPSTVDAGTTEKAHTPDVV